MRNVVVGYVVQEETAHPSQQGAVDSGDGSAEEGPCVLSEVGHGRVGVMEVSEHDDPVISKKVRNEVVLYEGRDRGVVCPESENGNPGKKEGIGEDYWDTVRFFEECRGRGPMLLET